MRFAGLAKKISSWVRPGVCEVRASIRRPVSALMRLDLPTLERPAKAISAPVVAGTAAREPAAARNCQGVAKSLRPVSISADDRAFQEGVGSALPGMGSVCGIHGSADETVAGRCRALRDPVALTPGLCLRRGPPPPSDRHPFRARRVAF